MTKTTLEEILGKVWLRDWSADDARDSIWGESFETDCPSPNDQAVEPSDLVAAGDGLLHALRAVQARLPCGCDDYGPCKRCAAAAIEAETAAEAWKEAKKEANEI